jgi:DNA-binding NtrC family response regulator
VVEVALPPLRERPGDLASLANAFVDRFAAEYHKPIRGISPAALRVLASARFPGNVRQLEHSLERAVILSGDGEPGGARGLLDVSSLGEDLLEEAATSAANAPAGSIPAGLEWLSDLTRAIPLREALEGPEKLLIERSLTRNEGRRDRAATELGINRSTLFNKMRKYGLLDVNFNSQRA